MVLGPFWDDSGEAAGKVSALRGQELTNYVRAVAQQLVDALKSAQQLTNDWSNEPLTDALVEAYVSDCVYRLSLTNLWGRDNQVPSGELWQIAGEFLEKGALQHQARFKPRGYAGDYQMLTRLCQRDCCADPLGRSFDRFFQTQAAVHAVRARTDGIAAALTAHRIECSAATANPYHVVSVGSGPAIEIERALKALPPEGRRSLRVSLLDLDAEALAAATSRLSPLVAPEQISAVRDNLYRLADKPRSAAPLAQANFLICSGFFDYLPDDSAIAMLRLFWSSLAPGGRLVVGNFAPHNPTRAFMEWIGNWYLLYRTWEDLQDLAQRAGIPQGAFRIGAEQLGIDLFLIVDRPR